MKRKIILGLSSLIGLFSCEKKEEGYKIVGELTGFESPQTIYVNRLSDSNRLIAIDSTKMVEGKFSINLDNPESREFHVVSFKKAKGVNIIVIPEAQTINVKGDKSKLREVEVTGGTENKVFSDFYNQIKKFQLIQADINKEDQEARQGGDYEGLKAVKARRDSLANAQKQMRFKVLNENTNSITAVMALSDMVNSKLVSASDAKSFFDKLPNDLKESRLGLRVKNGISSIVEIKNNIGDEVVNFNAPTPNGERLNLLSSLGKVTILDFWASWCRPCRMENPNVVRVYNKYKDKGLEIIGISFDKSDKKWKEAIKNDALTWKHVSNLKGWQEPIGKPFGIRSIPTTFLLDEKGVIIAKNLRGAALEEKIASLLD